MQYSLGFSSGKGTVSSLASGLVPSPACCSPPARRDRQPYRREVARRNTMTLNPSFSLCHSDLRIAKTNPTTSIFPFHRFAQSPEGGQRGAEGNLATARGERGRSGVKCLPVPFLLTLSVSGYPFLCSSYRKFTPDRSDQPPSYTLISSSSSSAKENSLSCCLGGPGRAPSGIP